MLNRQNVIKTLVDHFGEVFREDIERTLNLNKGGFSLYGRCGSFEIKYPNFRPENYTIFENERQAKEIAFEIALEDLKDTAFMYDDELLNEYVSISEYQKQIEALEGAYYFAQELTPREVYDYLGVSENEYTLEQARDLVNDKEYERIWDGLSNPYMYYIEILDRPNLVLNLGLDVDWEGAARALVEQKGWADILNVREVFYLKNGLVVVLE